MRTSAFAYPAVNLLHVLGLVLLLGAMLLLDLRLLGVGRRLPVPEVSALLTPLAAAGLLILLGTGALLFAADAAPLLRNPLFVPKMACIALGVINAIVFRFIWAGRLVHWDSVPPLQARLQAGASLLLWVAAACLGRLLAYM